METSRLGNFNPNVTNERRKATKRHFLVPVLALLLAQAPALAPAFGQGGRGGGMGGGHFGGMGGAHFGAGGGGQFRGGGGGHFGGWGGGGRIVTPSAPQRWGWPAPAPRYG